MFTPTTSIQDYTRVSSQCNQAYKRKKKVIQIRIEGEKLTLFAGDTIPYGENLMKSIKTATKTHEFSNVLNSK